MPILCICLFCGKVYISYIKYASFKLGGVYDETKLKNKVAVITGVSRLDGIGAAICKELAESGYDIFFTYWTAYDKEMPWGVDKNEQIQLKEELLKTVLKYQVWS